jgi:hypothetical protein
MPATPEAYYQEAGRGGRDGEPARAVMLYRWGDAEFHRLQLGVTFPPRRVLEAIWSGTRRRMTAGVGYWSAISERCWIAAPGVIVVGPAYSDRDYSRSACGIPMG